MTSLGPQAVGANGAAEMDLVARRAAGRRRPSGRVTLRTVFSGSITVSISSRPSPSVSRDLALDAVRDRAPRGRASGNRHRCPRHGRRAGGGRRGHRSSRCRRKSIRSAMVDFEPGMTTSPASSGSGSAGRDEHHLHLRLGLQRIEIVEIGDARENRHRDLQRPALAGRQPFQHHRDPRTAAWRPACSHGTMPKQRQPVNFSIAAIPSSNSETSPRNLLMR